MPTWKKASAASQSSSATDMTSDPFGFDRIDLGWLRSKRSSKWHRHAPRLAAWVADMDMPPAPAVLDAIRRAADMADLGYPDWKGTGFGSPAVDVFVDRARARYGWEVPVGEVRETCDVVQAVQLALHLASRPGDGVVLHMPAYPPLWQAIDDMGRRLVDVPAVVAADGVSFDYERLEQRLTAEPASVLLLCHPHNPTGHRFDRPELERLAAIAERFDLLVISDEIHADLTYAPARHLPIAALGSDVAARTVTVHSASKAFNIAGLRHAVAHIGPDHLRRAIAELPNHLLGALNVIAADATIAAWTEADSWLDAVVAHLDRNRLLLSELLAEHLPAVRYRIPDATYLAWLDCRSADLGDDPHEVFRGRGVELNPGPDFGPQGAGHVRLNMATSSSLLRAIVERMAGGAS
jgi:cystathionine beta-lyase